MKVRRIAGVAAAAALLLAGRPSLAEPPFAPDALDAWHLVQASNDPDVIIESLGEDGDCPTDLPGATTRIIAAGEADAWTSPGASDFWELAKVVQTDLSSPVPLSIVRRDGTLDVLPVSRVLSLVSSVDGQEQAYFCEYIAGDSPRATATDLDSIIVWPVHAYDRESEWPGVSDEIQPAHLGPLPQAPRYSADFHDQHVGFDQRIQAIGSVDAADIDLLLALPQQLRDGAISAEVATALKEPARMLVLTFSARTGREGERLWNVHWAGCDDDESIGCAYAWGLFRKTSGNFEPVYFESGRGESSIDVVRVLAVIDLDLDGIDEFLAEHGYYEGQAVDILTWRDGRLVTAYRGGYEGS